MDVRLFGLPFIGREVCGSCGLKIFVAVAHQA
jgi:hypothetical protein